MLKISKPVGPKQAKKYYRSELKKDAELSREASLAGESLSSESLSRKASAQYEGEWGGKLADEIGLRGAVSAEQFERLCDGRHPFEDKAMVRSAPVKNYIGKNGREITTMERRALWDATFSAPKSVSLAAAVGGDERVRNAHRESVRTALSELEKATCARMGGKNLSERTGKMISAAFEHDLARPDKVLKIATPQLHTHAAIFNVTQTENGATKAIQPLELYKSQSYATAVYRIELADKLQKLGYEIEIDAKTRAPEIKGFSSEYLKESSLRSQEINKEAELIKAKFELDGAVVKNDAGIRQVAAWQERQSKGFDVEEMRSRALELEVKYDFQAQRLYGQSLQNDFQYQAADSYQNARNAVDAAKEIIFPPAGLQKDLTRASLPTEKQFLTEALKNGIGITNYEAIQAEYSARYAAGEFSNLLKNENEKSIARVPDQAKTIETLQKAKEPEKALNLEREAKPSNEVKKFSMDELENAVRKSVALEKEAAQSLELLLAI